MTNLLGVNVNFNTTWANDYTDQIAQINGWGVTRIRTGIHWNDSQAIINAAHAGANLAKSKGLYVLWRNEATLNGTFDTSNWTAYKAAVVAQAVIAQAQGYDEFQVGNEMENAINGTITTTDIYNNMLDLAGQVKAVYSGKVSYSFSATNPGVWNANASSLMTNSNFDYLGANVYGGYNNRPNFINLAATHITNFSTKAEFTEFGIDSNWSNVPTDEEWQAVEVANRMTTINTDAVPAYFYDWRDNNDVFALRLQAGTYRLMFCTFRGGRRFLTPGS